MYLKSLLFLLSLFILTCAGKESEYKDLYTLKTLLDNAYKSQANPQSACETSMTTMQACAATAPEFTAVTLTETLFISTITLNQYTTYASYCTNTLNSALYINQSDALKECSFKCDTSYWSTRQSSSLCNFSTVSMIQGLGTDTGYISCRRNCLVPTNNDP